MIEELCSVMHTVRQCQNKNCLTTIISAKATIILIKDLEQVIKFF